ncbi:MAG: hypothetical protein M3082_22040 [Candidatus Dormibacteraeota bacterium]|nr:hypothetical protein [Candidatus Dormibacteraeota bacterium]
MTRSIAALVVVFAIAACGSSPGASGTNISRISVQPADLPAGMQRCDVSGDITTYLSNLKTRDQATYTTLKRQWDAAQSNGATAAEVVFYADSAANCASVTSKVSNISAAAYRLVVNFVVQFKDQPTAATGYTSGSIFGIDQSTLKTNGSPVTEGTKTGLGPNSIVLSVPMANQSFYIAVWQKKTFMVILGIINLGGATGQKVAEAQNKRIG